MMPLEYDYNIRFEFPRRPESAAAVAERFVKTLNSLSRIDALFTDWQITDLRRRASHPLAKVRPQLADVVARNVVRDDQGPSPEDGYHASAGVGKVDDPRGASFAVRAGGKSKNYGKLEFGSWRVTPDPAIVTYKRYRAALLAINAEWLPSWACAYALRSGIVAVPITIAPGVQATSIESVTPVPGDPTFPDTVFHIPWIAYLSPKLAAGLKLTPEILAEHTPDGGLLMTATEERLDPTNPEHLRRARILAETMVARAGDPSR